MLLYILLRTKRLARLLKAEVQHEGGRLTAPSLPPRSFDPVPSAPLGLIERRVSLGRQVVGAAAGLGTGGHSERSAEWPGAALPVPRRIGQLETNPAGDIAGADLFPDDAGKVDQRGIAGRMAEGVVQALEAIDVGIQQRPLPCCNRPEGLVEATPVMESGQRIDRGCSLVLVGFQRAIDARGRIV